MKGQNTVRSQDLNDGQRLWIQEVFYTIQGEGPFAGQPSVFIRTAGCNLKCYWCDTDFESSTWSPSLAELVERVDALRPPVCDLIVLTGGEPFRQNIRPLVEAMLEKGLRVQIETAGTLWVDLPDTPRITIVCSPKTRQLHTKLVPRLSALKYVLSSGEIDLQDGLPSMSTQSADKAMRLYRAEPAQNVPVYVMPRDEQDLETNARNVALCAEMAMKHGYRLCLQVHKLIGLP